MSTTDANPKNERSAQERARPHRGAGNEAKQGMAEMMAHCACGPEMMVKMAGLMGCTRPSPAKPSDETP